MSEFSYLQGLVLGILQGLAEFLPISSSGHLALAQQAMGLDAGSPPMLLFDIITHVATLAAVGLVFAVTFQRYLRRLIRESSSSFAGRRFAWRVAGYGVLASIPTALIGLFLNDTIKTAFGSPRVIAVGLVTTGCLLWVIGRIPRPRRGWRRFPWWGALVVGVAQGIAIFPGVSRSGSTICVALLLGLKRRWAGEFSFFIAAPAIIGAAILETKDTLELPVGNLADISWGPLGLGALSAFISGVVALKILLGTVRAGRLQFFCYYCWVLALVVLAIA
ncbi:MAG: undecaprenyl-diphosphate phosphatase [bacterium]|nr:undecaprenyl-diphosphate phosphatase [bacterium]